MDKLRAVALVGLLLFPALASGQAKLEAKDAVTGMWRGWYHYPAVEGRYPVSFQMALVQDGETVAGFTKEPNTFGKRHEPWLHGAVKGRYDPRARKITFTKTYDGTAGESHDVEYTAILSRDGMRLNGDWDIMGIGSDFNLERVKDSQAGPFSGVYTGVYHYPADSGRKPVAFQVIMVHHGQRVTGLIKEPNTFAKRDEPWLTSSFKGAVDPKTGRLTFLKTYDGTAGEDHDVEYTGQPSEDRGRIEGTWVLSDMLGGRFTMQRTRLDERGREQLK